MLVTIEYRNSEALTRIDEAVRIALLLELGQLQTLQLHRVWVDDAQLVARPDKLEASIALPGQVEEPKAKHHAVWLMIHADILGNLTTILENCAHYSIESIV